MATMVLLSLFLLVAAPPSFAAEKFKFGLSIRVPGYELPALTAQEKDIWKENGLEVEVVTFTGGGPFGVAMAAKGIKMGFSGGAPVFLATSRGVPVMIVSDLLQDALGFWVAVKGPLREPRDLAGARIGLSSLGSMPHAYGQVVARALGLEGKIKFVAVGGIPTRLAALKTGAIDGHISPFESMVRFQQAGEARELVRIRDHIPPDSVDSVIVAHKEVIASEAPTVARGVKATLQSLRFLRDNPPWGMQKLATLAGYSLEVAKVAYEDMMRRYTRDGKIKPKALENLREFLIEYKILDREKAPGAPEVYTAQFVS